MPVETIERRILTVGSEVRIEKREDGSRTLVGHAAVFNTLSEDLGGFREKIKRGAFKESLNRGDDVRALVEHQGGLSTIGRRSAQTLRVKEDKVGLLYEVDLPDTQAGRDLEVLVDRGDITQSSFQFRTIDDSWSTVDGMEMRELKRVDLIDVSPVTFPAYPETDVAVRSLEKWKKDVDAVVKILKEKTIPICVLKAKCDLAEAE